MRRSGFEPESSAFFRYQIWKADILPLNYQRADSIRKYGILKIIICIFPETRLEGFEPSTSSLGGTHSIQAELQALDVN